MDCEAMLAWALEKLDHHNKYAPEPYRIPFPEEVLQWWATHRVITRLKESIDSHL